MPAAANPTTPSLWAGRIFTAIVFGLAILAVVDALTGEPTKRTGYLFMAAGVIYSVGALILYMRGDYILRLFGCAWPFLLPKLDEMQQAHRQRAFSATFAVFTGLFSFFVGIQIGAVALDLINDETPTTLLPSEPLVMVLCLTFVLLILTLTPQAYLAWTLKPLDEDFDDEAVA
ncbi:hypothetical protein NHF45_08885 [Maricaulaceae bacterium NA33B04]|nr:hypothetical protein [Maricaulaceae bacterium NA33B04]